MDYNIASNDIVLISNAMIRLFLAPHRQSTDFPTYAPIYSIVKIEYFDESWTKVYLANEEYGFYANYKIDVLLSMISCK